MNIGMTTINITTTGASARVKAICPLYLNKPIENKMTPMIRADFVSPNMYHAYQKRGA